MEIFQIRVESGGEKFGKLPTVGSRIDSRIIGTARDTDTAIQSGQDEEGDGTIEPTIPQGTSEADSIPPQAPKTGVTKQGVTNDNGAYAYQPMRGNFDIAYLPDFDEQYVISGSAGLGNAQFQLNLGQGWSLQGFDSLTDNSALNARIFDVIDAASQVAQSAALAAVGLPPVPSLLPGTTATAPQGAQDAVLAAGTRVTLKIVVVHYAAKGLYPVIKPRELQERSIADGEYFLSLNLFGWLPIATPGTNFDQTAIERARTAAQGETAHFTAPRYPYQYVSFNTFRYMAIEALTPAAHPFGALYDKTGTQGDPGDRRTETPPPTSSGLPVSGQTLSLPAQPTPREPDGLGDLSSLRGQRIKVGNSNFLISEAPRVEDGKAQITLEAIGAVEDGVTSDAVIKEIRAVLGPGAPPAQSFEIANPQVLTAAAAPQSGRDEPAHRSISAAQVRSIQAALCLRGGSIDGVWGEQTRQMLIRYQRETGREPDGVLTTSLSEALQGLSAAEIGARCRLQPVEPTVLVPQSPLPAPAILGTAPNFAEFAAAIRGPRPFCWASR